ncbi:hypothetical protein [Streptomyces sp. NPDC045369]|uniref:hypothetical protein n=1 Tax=Streptomyces sp. NPDC045369 TaxID=3155732 RepID=UPI0033C4FE2F
MGSRGGPALDDLLVVGFDLQTQTEVHIGERPLEQWRALSYGRGATVVCGLLLTCQPACWVGVSCR